MPTCSDLSVGYLGAELPHPHPVSQRVPLLLDNYKINRPPAEWPLATFRSPQPLSEAPLSACALLGPETQKLRIEDVVTL